MTNESSEILEAGRRALTRHGYHGATGERIAEEAGVSRVTLHRRGINRDTILAELQEAAIASYREALWPALTAEGTAAKRIEQALEALCELTEDNLSLLVALRSQSDAVFHDDTEEGLTRSIFTEPFERLLRDGAQDGSLDAGPSDDSAEAATVLFNMVAWTYLHLRTGHGWDPERARTRVVGLALNGLLS